MEAPEKQFASGEPSSGQACEEEPKQFQLNGENLSEFLPNYAASMCKSQLENYDDESTLPSTTKKSPSKPGRKKKKKPKSLMEYQCDQCPHRALSSILLKVHKKSHQEGSIFSCLFCPYTTTISRYLQCHMQSHEGEKISSCKYCPYKTSSNLRLERHMKTHTGEKPFACSECPYKSAKPESLKKHMRIHKAKKTRERTSYRTSNREPVKRRVNPARQPSTRNNSYVSTSRMDTATLHNRLEVIRSAVDGLYDKDDHEHFYAEYNRLLRLNGLEYCCFDWRGDKPVTFDDDDDEDHHDDNELENGTNESTSSSINMPETSQNLDGQPNTSSSHVNAQEPMELDSLRQDLQNIS